MYYRQVPPCMMYGQMPIMNMPENAMPMANMPTNIMPIEDNDLDMLYPTVYFNVIPMVRLHCDKMESKYGMFFSPSKHEMEDLVEELSDRFEKEFDDDDEKSKKNKKDECREDDCIDEYQDDVRQRRRFGRRRLLRDLIGIIFLNELRDRRRRRRRPHHGYGNDYGNGYSNGYGNGY